MPGKSAIVVEVWDENVGSKDKFMGQVALDMPSFAESGVARDLSLPLVGNNKYGKDKAQGTITLTVLWTSIMPEVNDSRVERETTPKTSGDDVAKNTLKTSVEDSLTTSFQTVTDSSKSTLKTSEKNTGVAKVTDIKVEGIGKASVFYAKVMDSLVLSVVHFTRFECSFRCTLVRFLFKLRSV